jgi:hypothetical protein
MVGELGAEEERSLALMGFMISHLALYIEPIEH